jgi:hypothetical protein
MCFIVKSLIEVNPDLFNYSYRLQTESCTDSVKFQCYARLFLAGLKVSDHLGFALRTTPIADRTIDTTVICSICQ